MLCRARRFKRQNLRRKMQIRFLNTYADRVLVRLAPTIEQVLYYRVYTPPPFWVHVGDLKREIKMKGPKLKQLI